MMDADDIVFVDALGDCPTGKIQKIELRRRFALFVSNTAGNTAGRRFSAA